MKNQFRKFVVGLLTLAMVVSTITPAAFAAPSTTTGADGNTDETSLSSTAETNIASANIVASLEDSGEETEDSEAKSAVKDAVFNNYNDTTDLSEHGISSEEMDSATEEVLEENNLTDLVEVTYETDSNDTVTTAEVTMDDRVALAADELEEKSNVYNLTDEQAQNLLGLYAQYAKSLEDHADIYGVQVAYNTTKDTNANPIGSLLDIASIPETGADYDTMAGLVQIYYMATEISAQAFGDQIKQVRNQALASLNKDMTDVQKYLALNDWLANYCTFSMASIMDNIEAPEPAESQLHAVARQAMYNMIREQVYNQVYDAVKDSYDEDTAKAIADAQADSYMNDQTDDPNGNGSQQAASTADTITGLWESTQVGAFIGKSAVCLGYASAYTYLVQCAFPEVYLNEGGNLDTASAWKSYKELNYQLNEDGTPVTDENGDCVWSADSAAIVDQVKIIYDTESSMFGESGHFDSPHYWNAVKTDGKWYYVDPCYTDIYIECMNRDRVETDGNMNHLYFMFSDSSARQLYDGYFSDIITLYQDIATDTTYEDAWVAFIKSQTYQVDGRAYYLYDSTDMLDIMNQSGGVMGTSSNLNERSSERAADNPYGDIFGDTELKVVYHDTMLADSDASFVTLVDFNNGQIYDPGTDAMVDNAMIAELYAEYTEATEQYPSIAISTAYYGGKVYFSLSNCILSYDLETGTLEKLVEYTKVSGQRDLTVALGGMGFTMTNDASGENTITVENPPIADMTIKDDGKMYVSVATCYGFASGKGDYTDEDGTVHNLMEDDRSYGYKFAETNYNPDYNTYYSSSDDTNDNDEFMWSANIVGTIEMSHLTGTEHSYSGVSVPESCTEDAYTVSRCTECGLIQESTEETPEEGGSTGETPEEGEPAEETPAEETPGHGHRYIKLDETYYTKDDNGNRNTGTAYSCIDCGKSFDADELEENKTDADEVFDITTLSGDKANVWTHSADYTQAALYRVPVELQDHMFDCVWENADISTRTVATVSQKGDCVSGLTYTYTATVDGQDYTDTEDVAYDAHTYAAEWTWAEDYSTATVKLTCDVCGDVAEETASTEDQSITQSGYTAETCEEAGSVSYTAKVTHDDVNYTSSRTQEIPAKGHSYGEPAWEWTKAEDGSYTATATFTCETDASHVEKQDATVEIVTDEATGTKKYVATVTFNDTTYTSEHELELRITTDPTDYTGEVGTKAEFTVAAEGNGELTYQWQFKNVNSNSWQKSSQSGSTTDTLTVPITEARDGQQYRCVVTDENGNTVISNAAAIHATAATPKITITSQPADYTGEVGTSATFTVAAEGNSELTYQWQFKNDGSNFWQNSSQSGSTTDTLTVPITKARDGQQYRCVITDADGNTVTSNAAAVHATEATPKITITSQPEDYTGEVGTKATFTVAAEGNELTYQWQYQNVGSSYWQNSSQSGSTTNTLTVPVTEARDGQKYRCVITDADGNTVTSNAAAIHATAATPKITIDTQPTDYTGAVGTDATFTVEATGNSELTYQWQYQNAGSSYWQNSSQNGNKTATLTVPITEARNGQQYRCVITDADGNTVTSNAASIIVG